MNRGGKKPRRLKQSPTQDAKHQKLSSEKINILSNRTKEVCQWPRNVIIFRNELIIRYPICVLECCTTHRPARLLIGRIVQLLIY